MPGRTEDNHRYRRGINVAWAICRRLLHNDGLRFRLAELRPGNNMGPDRDIAIATNNSMSVKPYLRCWTISNNQVPQFQSLRILASQDRMGTKTTKVVCLSVAKIKIHRFGCALLYSMPCVFGGRFLAQSCQSSILVVVTLWKYPHGLVSAYPRSATSDDVLPVRSAIPEQRARGSQSHSLKSNLASHDRSRRRQRLFGTSFCRGSQKAIGTIPFRVSSAGGLYTV